MSFVEADLHDADARHPAQRRRRRRAACCSPSARAGASSAHRETDGSLHVYIALRVAEDWIDTVDFTDTASRQGRAARGVRRLGRRSCAALIADADGRWSPRAASTRCRSGTAGSACPG